MTSSEIRASTAQSRIMCFYCGDCVDVFRDAIGQLPKMKQRIEDLETSTKELKSKLNSDQTKTYAQVTADTKNLKNQVAELKEAVKAIIESLNSNIPDINIKVSRIDKPTDYKIRPLRATFNTPDEAKQILRNKRNLNNNIKSDRTPIQRQFPNSLVEELERRTAK
ncbi:hypothetical protein HHI36_018609 [Cryptolaemus montrouzieri]|uniref:Uncharacterized protein n=1 Tax=Cryptolaemus montrouzieri TaxID=559131 RepID=A0ABD2P1L9_9CUCU